VDETTPRRRFVRDLLYRLALLPPCVILIAAALVYTRTHPPSAAQGGSDPLTQGVFYEPVNLLSEDGVRLEAWLVPALDASQVLAEGNQSLHDRWPAVVLVHGFGMSRQQVLPLVAPLHMRGYVVLVLATRGSGGETAAAGQTFGLNESMDVKAAVDLLRRRPFVDGSQIAIVGIGSGANAAVLDAEHDPKLAALVLDSPAQTGDQALEQNLLSQWPMFKCLFPICKVAFAVGYGVDIDELDLDQYGRVLAARPTLLMRWPQDTQNIIPPQRVAQITEFLGNALTKTKDEANDQ
jgi:pimeloyl-ACP methyl ester carboxylesterase